MGVESQALATLRRGSFRVHLNAGGFYDARPADDECGWRGSVLIEQQRGRARLGIEIFAKKVRSEEARAQLGPGVILQMGSFDIRAGLHVGLTSETPDLAVSFWISRKWPLWRSEALHRSATLEGASAHEDQHTVRGGGKNGTEAHELIE